MLGIRRIFTTRWWNKKKIRIFFGVLLFLIFVRISKGSIYKDFYYVISKPFWPGRYQKEVILKSLDQESLIKLNLLENDNKRLREILDLQRVADADTITAKVISRKDGSWWRQIILNKGSKDGVEVGSTVIGPGGRTIKGITERTNTKIDIEDGGIVTIASHDGAAAEEAQKIIEGLTRKVHEGEIFSGVVTRIIPIGAFVEILPGKEGMVHISQLSEARVERVEDVVRQGDEVTVRVREIDSRGRINLTLRGVAQNGGMSYPEPTPTPVAPLN